MTAPDGRFELAFARALHSFDTIEPALDGFFERVTLRDRPAYVTRLVVEEVVRNLVEHATGGRDEVRLEIACTADWVTVVIEDDGEPFHPADAAPLDVDAPVEERGHRGMGLHLVREMTDRLQYERLGNRNRLVACIDRHRRAA